MDVGKLGIWYFFDGASSAEVAASAQRIEDLGYSTLGFQKPWAKTPLSWHLGCWPIPKHLT